MNQPDYAGRGRSFLSAQFDALIADVSAQKPSPLAQLIRAANEALPYLPGDPNDPSGPVYKLATAIMAAEKSLV